MTGAKTPGLPLTGSFSTLMGALGKFERESEVGGGEGVLPILTVAGGHAQISRDDWIKLRQESRNCLSSEN